jgi:hypothetical protein
MRRCYRERLKAIRHCPLFCIVLGAAGLALTSPRDSIADPIACGAVLLGGAAAYCFWTVYLGAHPEFSERQRVLLLALYALGTVAFLSAVGVMVWSIANRHGGVFHWLMVVFGVVDVGENFGVRWVDGRYRWRAYGSPRHWLGGAAGVAVRRRTALWPLRHE